jgi:hypothetical protein
MRATLKAITSFAVPAEFIVTRVKSPSLATHPGTPVSFQ